MREISENAMRILRAKYLLEGETVEEMFHRVASAVAQAEAESEKWSSIFYDLLSSWDFVPGGRILAGAGTPNGQLFNCFVLPIEDSMESIFETLKNAALVLKAGGGTGFSFSRLRPKGDVVATSRGIASGPVSFIKVFDSAAGIIRQGGMRRGANMAILRVDHPDIMEFISCKAREGELSNFNISVGVTDKFMEALERDEEFPLIHPNTKKVVKKLPAREIFDLMVEMAWRNGEPGAVFLDTINRFNPTPALGEIESTNPCIVGDALVATEHGLMRMEELVRRYAEGGIRVAVDRRMLGMSQMLFEGTTGQPIWAIEEGVEFLPISRAFKTGVKPTVKVTTRSGCELILTPDHKVMTTRGWVPAGELIPGRDEIFIQSGAGLFNDERKLPFEVRNEYKGSNGRTYRLNLPGEWSYELGFVLGWLVGDGWVRSGDKNCRVGFTFGEDDLEVMEEIKRIVNGWYGADIKPVKRGNGIYHLSYHSRFLVDFFLKLGVKPVKAAEKEVPESIFGAPRDAVIGFLRGLFTADGTAEYYEEHGIFYVRLTSKSLKLLKGVQLLLLNLGIRSRIFDRSRPQRSGFKYRTVSGEERVYKLDGICYELSVTRQNVKKFADMIGFHGGKHSDKLDRMIHRRLRRENFIDVVESVEKDRRRTVYDLTVPIAHSFITNGIVISNCGEQPLLPNEACCLGSINLANLVKNGDFDWERLGEVTRLAVRFLDDVIDVTRYPLAEIEKMSKGNRKIGLGIMGWADALYQMGIPYDSEEGIEKAEEVMKFINEAAWGASEELAREKGPFPFIEHAVKPDWLRRNAAVTTIAPTGSISMISEASSGIEPVFALVYYKKVLEGEKLPEVNRYLVQALKEKGLYSEELIRKIEEKGSIREIPEIPEEIKRVFVTSMDIAPEWHVRMQAAFQKYTDNAVSKCLAKGTLIPTNKGLIPIEELGFARGDDVFADPISGLKVVGPDGKWHDVTAHYSGGIQRTKIIRLSNGTKIEGTFNHRIMTINGWRRLDELKPGDLIVCTRPVSSGKLGEIPGWVIGIGFIGLLGSSGSKLNISYKPYNPINPVTFLLNPADGRQWTADVEDRYLVKVAEIEEGESEVYDIEVSEVHSYVVDGVITHNTINLPHEATREDVARAFKLAYELGCKGITIYRYGSREEQVLNLVSEERRKETRGKVGPRPRPTVTRGATIRMLTGCGKLYVTINEDEQGLIEVFVNAGKSGGCVASQNEAIGRLISLGLRSGVDVQAIIKEMRGIKCPQPAWQDGELIQSCADAIGRAIELYLRQNGKWESEAQIKSVQFSSPPSQQASSRSSSISSNEAGMPPECPKCGGPLEFVEGCVVCRNCGYSKCD
ncbi:TSCPD domain-containing protein [Candidatus Poribacteria bacterium]|nr:TSCPD domain-containing protein [Candidatus Poribacteria bacterium]